MERIKASLILIRFQMSSWCELLVCVALQLQQTENILAHLCQSIHSMHCLELMFSLEDKGGKLFWRVVLSNNCISVRPSHRERLKHKQFLISYSMTVWCPAASDRVKLGHCCIPHCFNAHFHNNIGVHSTTRNSFIAFTSRKCVSMARTTTIKADVLCYPIKQSQNV